MLTSWRSVVFGLEHLHSICTDYLKKVLFYTAEICCLSIIQPTSQSLKSRKKPQTRKHNNPTWVGKKSNVIFFSKKNPIGLLICLSRSRKTKKLKSKQIKIQCLYRVGCSHIVDAFLIRCIQM